MLRRSPAIRQVGALAARETAAMAADQADREDLRARVAAREMAQRVLDDLVDPAEEMPIANLRVSMDPRGHE